MAAMIPQSPPGVSRPTPLRGRDDESGLLRDHPGAVSRGQSGIVVIKGTPGAGKSRLLAEVRAAAEHQAPLPITVDDLQWCDPVTLPALRTLPARLSAHVVRWVPAARSEAGPASLRST
jgi:predicted ATPase